MELTEREELCGPACHHADKATWPDGPWKQEPDRLEFRHAGLACLLHRSSFSGGWCGYVGLPASHPLHGRTYQEIATPEIQEVHGGLTYSAHCSPPICHIPEPGESANLWWLGFDCGHYLDLAPGMMAREIALGFRRGAEGQTYRTIDYARSETENLAKQLAAYAAGAGVWPEIQEVHGGLTYSAHCSPPICHIPEPGESANLWWLGFDCGHYLDLAPGMMAREIALGFRRGAEGQTYRTIDYARSETENLAKQLAAYAAGAGVCGAG